MANSNSSQDIEDLAAEIGANVYIDVARWHLYLAEAHLHTVLAEQFYPMLTRGVIAEDQVVEVLQSTPVKLGGGRHELPLLELLPMQAQVALVDILETFQRNL